MNYLARFLMPWCWIAVNGAPIYCLAARLDVTLSPLTGVMHTAVTHSYMFPIASINRACLCTVVTLSCPLRRHCVANASNAYCSTRSRSSVCCIRQLNTSLSDAVQCHHCDVQCCRIYASVHNACDSNPSRQVACHMHQRNTSRVGAAASAQYHRAATYERNAYGSNPSPSKACRTPLLSKSFLMTSALPVS